MGLSLADVEKLRGTQVGDLLYAAHPHNPANRRRCDEVPFVAATMTEALPGEPRSSRRPKSPKVNELGQNQTEERFGRALAEAVRRGEILDFYWEPMKLILAGNTSLRLDYLVRRLDGSFVGIDVKGFMRDDAGVKLKVAARMHPWISIVAAYAEGRFDWTFRRATSRGGFGDHEPLVDFRVL